mmetsp:Transcript_15924/g.18459  ORF Transcript_15924/g.18459 Transcript_15924/m.18459 type:complete len:199 (-) Transcript_15924:72-668(-)
MLKNLNLFSPQALHSAGGDEIVSKLKSSNIEKALADTKLQPISQPLFNVEGPNLSEMNWTIYENFVLFTKNDINLQLLKDYEYSTEVRTTSTGRKQTVYVCIEEGCAKEFLRTCNLLDHVRMHKGIKPNMCEYCGKGFTQRSNLRKHLKVHQKPELEERKRYKCRYCESSYTERYNYKKHLIKTHGLQIGENLEKNSS